MTDKKTTAADLDDLMGEAEVRLHPILTNDQVREAQAKARKAIEAQRVSAAMKAVEALEVKRLAREEGFTIGDAIQDEIVHISIDLPRCATHISINGGMRVYHHGRSYDVPRHIANTLSETMSRLWTAEEQADGKSKYEMLWKPRHAMIDGNTGVIGTMH